jgi:hypothetical protein
MYKHINGLILAVPMEMLKQVNVRDLVAQKMTPQQISQEQEARKWMDQHNK